MTDRTYNINFNPNRNEEIKTGKVAPTPKKTKKDFKKVLAKEGRDEQRDSKNKELAQKSKTDESDTSYEDVELKLEAYDQKPKTKGVSLFDIASNSKSVEEVDIKTTVDVSAAKTVEDSEINDPITDMPEEIQEKSLSALFKGYGTKEKLQSMQMEIKNFPYQSADPQLNALRAKESSKTPQDDLQKPVQSAKKIEIKSDVFPREQADLAAVNPNAGLTPLSAPVQTQGVHPPPVRVQELQVSYTP